MIVVREETSADVAAVRHVILETFGQSAEADLVDRLRENDGVTLSLVAIADEVVVGHILFSGVEIDCAGTVLPAVGLAPMAVLPQYQRSGIGGRLVQQGIELLRGAGHEVVVVLGHANYYPRFGFVPAGRFGLSCKWEVPDDVFMAQELRPGALAGKQGRVNYRAEFDAF